MVVQIEIEGLRNFTRELKRVDKAFGPKLRQVHLRIAVLVEGRTHSAMRAGGGQASAAVRGVRAKATQKMAAIQTSRGPGWTLGVIWGQRRRTGWYARPRYRASSGRQFRPWVGNQYEPGSQAGKPYFLGDAMNSSIDEAIDLFGDAIDELAREAGFT